MPPRTSGPLFLLLLFVPTPVGLAADDTLEALAGEYLEERGESRSIVRDPAATGFESRRADRLQQLDEWTHRLEGLDWEGLDREQRIDHVVLRKLILQERHRLDRAAELRAALASPIGAPVSGLVLPEEHSVEALERDRARLERWLSSIRKAPEPEAAALHLEELDLAVSFLEESREQVERWIEGVRSKRAGDEAAWEKLARRAQKVLDGRQLALRGVRSAVVAREGWGRPVGAREMELRIRHQHLIDRSLEDLVVLGRSHLRRIQQEMESLADSIEPGASAGKFWEQLTRNHPSAEELPDVARQEMESALALLLEQDLMTIAEPYRHAEVVVTTGRTNQTYPFGGYGGTRREGERQVGRYLVSPPTEDMTPEQRAERLRGNNVYWTRVVAVHEIWPGHHLQGLVAREKASPLRRRYFSTVMSEGWGLYSEQLMNEHGHFDLETRMAQLKMQAWRAARVVIDVRLQTGGMSVDDAVSFLVHEVGLTRENSEAEVRRYLGNPTRPLSYFVGFLQLMQLRDEVQAAEGDAFDLKSFHDRVLSYGTIPVVLIRYGMTGKGDLRGL